MEIYGHKHLLHHTMYHVNQWCTEHLTAKQLCKHFNNGLTPGKLTRDNPEDEDTPILSIPFRVTWKPAWVPEETILITPKRKTTIDNYAQRKAPIRNKTRTASLTFPPQTKGWHPKHTTFTSRPINSDMETAPTGSFKITRHPINDDEVLLHALDGRLIPKLTKALHTVNKATLTEALSELTYIYTALNIVHNEIAETKLHKHYKLRP